MKKSPQQQQFGNWLKAQRLGLEITATEAAKRAGMDPTTWRAYEAPGTKAHNPSPIYIKKFAAVLGVPVEEVAKRAGVWMPTEEFPSVSIHTGVTATPDVAEKLDELTDELRRLIDVLSRMPGLAQPARRARKPAQ